MVVLSGLHMNIMQRQKYMQMLRLRPVVMSMDQSTMMPIHMVVMVANTLRKNMLLTIMARTYGLVIISGISLFLFYRRMILLRPRTLLLSG